MWDEDEAVVVKLDQSGSIDWQRRLDLGRTSTGGLSGLQDGRVVLSGTSVVRDWWTGNEEVMASVLALSADGKAGSYCGRVWSTSMSASDAQAQVTEVVTEFGDAGFTTRTVDHDPWPVPELESSKLCY
jgi:hypothetical protein